MKETWLRQREELQRLAAEEGFWPDGKKGPLSTARSFVESLILCPNEDAARRLLRADREATRAFLHVARDMDPVFESAEGGLPESGKRTPFYELCDITMTMLDGIEREFPEAYS